MRSGRNRTPIKQNFSFACEYISSFSSFLSSYQKSSKKNDRNMKLSIAAAESAKRLCMVARNVFRFLRLQRIIFEHICTSVSVLRDVEKDSEQVLHTRSYRNSDLRPDLSIAAVGLRTFQCSQWQKYTNGQTGFLNWWNKQKAETTQV